MYDTALIEELLNTAGNIALQYFRKVEPSLKENKTYVTNADLEIQEYLRDELSKRFPDDGIIAEEQNLRIMPKGGDTYWIIDPIDGTASFVNGLPVWGIAIGLVREGNPHAGFFYMPATGDLFSSTAGGFVYRNHQVTRRQEPQSLHRESVLLTSSGLHKRYRISQSYTGKVRSLGSTIAHLCYVATGSADAALLGRAQVWDLAAGFALVTSNGGEFQYLWSGTRVSLLDVISGEPAREPMLAGHISTIEQYREVISLIEPLDG